MENCSSNRQTMQRRTEESDIWKLTNEKGFEESYLSNPNHHLYTSALQICRPSLKFKPFSTAAFLFIPPTTIIKYSFINLNILLYVLYIYILGKLTQTTRK